MSQLQQSSGVGAATRAGFWFWAEELQRSSCWFDIYSLYSSKVTSEARRSLRRQGGRAAGRCFGLLINGCWKRAAEVRLALPEGFGTARCAPGCHRTVVKTSTLVNDQMDVEVSKFRRGFRAISKTGHLSSDLPMLLKFLELCNYVKHILWSICEAVKFPSGPYFFGASTRLGLSSMIAVSGSRGMLAWCVWRELKPAALTQECCLFENLCCWAVRMAVVQSPYWVKFEMDGHGCAMCEVTFWSQVEHFWLEAAWKAFPGAVARKHQDAIILNKLNIMRSH